VYFYPLSTSLHFTPPSIVNLVTSLSTTYQHVINNVSKKWGGSEVFGHRAYGLLERVFLYRVYCYIGTRASPDPPQI